MRKTRFAWYLLVAPLAGGVAFIVWMQAHACLVTAHGCGFARWDAYDFVSVFLVAYTFGLPPAVLGAAMVGLLEQRWAGLWLSVAAAIGAMAAAWSWAVYEVAVFKPVFGLRYGALVELAVPFVLTAGIGAIVAEAGLRWRSAPARTVAPAGEAP